MKTRRFLAQFDVREKAGLISAVVLVWLGLNMAFAFTVNLPRGRRVAELDTTLSEASSALARKQQEVEKLREHFDRVVGGRASLDKFYADVLSTKQNRLISFQREIRGIADQFKINVDTISYPRETFPKDKVTRFSATMPLTGSYENLRQFIDTIEHSENFIVIDAIQLANSKEGGVILGLSIQLSTFFVDPDIQEQDTARKGTRG